MSMTLSSLHADPGSRKKRRRVGRGHGSGRGKTSGKGTKGQKARAGGSIPAFFEGGQNSLVHRMPVKRGLHFCLCLPAELHDALQFNIFLTGSRIRR